MVLAARVAGDRAPGSAHDEAELEALKAAAQQRIAAGQLELDLGLEPAGGGPLPITSSKISHLVDSLERAYRGAGAGRRGRWGRGVPAPGAGQDHRAVSKLDSLRVLDEAGVTPASYRTLKRRLPVYAQEEWRQRLSAACAAHARLGPASLVLYDVSTLYFETDQGDGFREPGFSKERRLEPQITIGLLTDQSGFPLGLSASRATGPRPRPCCRSSRTSWPPTSSPMSRSSPTPA